MEEQVLEVESIANLQSSDWLVLIITLVLSAAIGIYYRFTGGRQMTATEYYTANRSTGAAVLSIAITVAFISGVTMLGISGETYAFGVQYNIVFIGTGTGGLLTAYVFLPVFYELKTMSIFEYLEKRFGIAIRIVISSVNLLMNAFYTGLVLYAPSLTLEATTGISLFFSVVLIGGICTFYSAIGGIKAIMVTDVLQGFIMFSSLSAVVYLGLYDYKGSIWDILELAGEGGRLNLFDPEMTPMKRHTWICLLVNGVLVFSTMYGTNQVQMQRMLSAKSLGTARRALLGNFILMMIMTTMISFSGVLMYAYYKGCDPVLTGELKSFDMLLPYFAKQHLTRIPGLTGLFISGIFSASLSTISALINSLSAVVLSDYVKPICQRFGHEVTERRGAYYGKILAVFVGIITMGMTYLASKVKSLISTLLLLNGVLAAPILGVFFLGMLFETTNEIGAVIGSLTGLGINLILTMISTLRTPILAVSAENCLDKNVTISQVIISASKIIPNDAHWITRLSYMWYLPIGTFFTVTVGVIASIIVDKMSTKSKPLLEPNLFIPIVADRIRRQRAKAIKIDQEISIVDLKL